MIRLTNQFDNPVDISPSCIEMLEITTLYPDKAVAEQRMGVKVHLTSGKSVDVQECLKAINKLLEDYWTAL